MRAAISLRKNSEIDPSNSMSNCVSIFAIAFCETMTINQRLLDGIGLQHDQGRLLRFLETEGVEPTNNRAERILRPAVIARKVSHCSKNQRGADAFAAFVSLAQTACKSAQQTVSQVFLSLFSTTTALPIR